MSAYADWYAKGHTQISPYDDSDLEMAFNEGRRIGIEEAAKVAAKQYSDWVRKNTVNPSATLAILKLLEEK